MLRSGDIICGEVVMINKLIGGKIRTRYFDAMRRLSSLKPIFLFLKNKYYQYDQAIFLASLERAKLSGEMEFKQKRLSALEDEVYLLASQGNISQRTDKTKLEKQFARQIVKDINKLNDSILGLEDTIARLKTKRERLWRIIKKDEL